MKIFYTFLISSLIACQSTNESPVSAPPAPFTALTPAEENVDIVDVFTSEVGEEETTAGNETSTAAANDRSIFLNPNEHQERSEVRAWINTFTGPQKELFQRYLNRGEKYRSMIEGSLISHGLPAELFFLAMMESGFVTAARSHASAVGVWQFVEGTGKRYGLKVSKSIDERQDPVRSTMAAIQYLGDLYNVFHSWPLAMAGYNAGEMRIVRAIMQHKSRDYWQLVDDGVLPKETSKYIPKIIAAAIIGSDPEAYGLKRPPQQNFPGLNAVSFPTPTTLSHIADLTSLPLETLKDYNPHIRDGRLVTGSSYKVWIPDSIRITKEMADSVKRFSPPAPTRRSLLAKGGGEKAEKRAEHRVLRRETLASIGKKYGLSAELLKEHNHLKSSKLRVGQKLLIPVQTGSDAESRVSTRIAYRVRSGDNLYKIAKKFNVSPEDIKKWNAMERSRLFVGQVLRIHSQKPV